MIEKNFRVGDKVKCIDIGYSKCLKLNNIYTIKELKSNASITVEEIIKPHKYYKNKFVNIDISSNYEIY